MVFNRLFLKHPEGHLIKLEGLRELFQRLKEEYKLIAPTLKDGVIVYGEVDNLEDIALGYRNIEGPGFYSLERAEGYFTYTHPANSPKTFLHPSELTLMRVKRSKGMLEFEEVYPKEKVCLFDVRACDLQAIGILDMVFLEKNPKEDPYYKELRSNTFTVAVDCTYATSTCFCTTMGTGPWAEEGYDLVLKELKEVFLIKAGSQKGQKLLESIQEKEEVKEENLREWERRSKGVEGLMKLHFEREGLSQRLYGRMDSSHWEPIGKRCLACTSCTQVCPTCFCFDLLEKNSMDMGESERVRVWDSCFSPSFATVHRFNIRQSIHSRYRQWLMHKFAYWLDQFGTFGCVGCGRCITWCPVGIDIRQEVKKLVG
ncbi:MAG: 4Fe-4S dicluster domain-containing protein [Aquificaceae bacterium]